MILFVSVAALFFAGCSPAPASQYSYQPPEQIDDGLNAGKLGDVNIDSALIEQAVARISDGQYGELHALLIFKDNQLVPEEYFMGHKFESGVVFTSSSLALTPREMVKFGAMFLNNGVWDGQQIVTGQWVEKSANNYPGPDNSWYNSFLKPIPPDDNTRGKRGYTYSWWTHELSHSGSKLPMYYANGWGGQDIMIFPDLDTVIVFTGGNYTSNTTIFEVVTDYLLPASEG